MARSVVPPLVSPRHRPLSLDSLGPLSPLYLQTHTRLRPSTTALRRLPSCSPRPPPPSHDDPPPHLVRPPVARPSHPPPGPPHPPSHLARQLRMDSRPRPRYVTPELPPNTVANVLVPFSAKAPTLSQKQHLRLRRLPTEDDVVAPAAGVEKRQRWIWAPDAEVN